VYKADRDRERDREREGEREEREPSRQVSNTHCLSVVQPTMVGFFIALVRSCCVCTKRNETSGMERGSGSMEEVSCLYC
jgi:hypothetical protein